MNCRQARGLLVPLIDGELAPAHEAQLAGHLSTCERCAQAHHDLVVSTPLAPVVLLHDHARHEMHLALDNALREAASTVPSPRIDRWQRLRSTLTAEVVMPRATVLAAAAILVVLVGATAGSRWLTSADAPVAQRAQEAPRPPTASLTLHRPAAYTPQDGWF